MIRTFLSGPFGREQADAAIHAGSIGEAVKKCLRSIDAFRGPRRYVVSARPRHKMRRSSSHSKPLWHNAPKVAAMMTPTYSLSVEKVCQTIQSVLPRPSGVLHHFDQDRKHQGPAQSHTKAGEDRRHAGR